MLAVRCLSMYGTGLLKVHKLKAAEALALLAETEYFTTYRGQFIDGEGSDDVAKLLEFKEIFLTDLMTDFENRKGVRPLVDAIDKAKRLQKK